MSGPAQTTIRFYRPTDSFARITELCEVAGTGVPIPEFMNDPVFSAFLVDIPRTGAQGLRARATQAPYLESLVWGLHGLLVAQAEDGSVVAMADFGPPPDLAELAYSEDPATAKHGVGLMLAATQLHTLAVLPSHQGQGIGAALLRRTRGLFTTGGFRLMHGQCDAQDVELERFYESQGFEVFTPGEALLLGVAGRQWSITPTPGARYFAHTLGPSPWTVRAQPTSPTPSR
ncbi:GNAT family N-acetyltransferase [Oerskovia sp. Sa1BUA8]|uniref:GNAT family N-acetyltransferase n=1 Tax=Oerskovia douganii TaxID=2762210 RepID=A0A9D5UBR4_9CELL|nr:GNAT family N-acetyltransferase [Oerskovia douganii]MBE7702183.1 GNAT family N-acetyltransferase [Oerskovia douganii]